MNSSVFWRQTPRVLPLSLPLTLLLLVLLSLTTMPLLVSAADPPNRCKCICPNNTTIISVQGESECECDTLLQRLDCGSCQCTYESRNDTMIKAMVYIFLSFLSILTLLVVFSPVARWYYFKRPGSAYFSTRGIPAYMGKHIDNIWEMCTKSSN